MVARGHDRPAGRAACLARAVGRGPHHASTGAKAGAASCAGVAGREIMRRSRAGWGGDGGVDLVGEISTAGRTGRRDVREPGEQRGRERGSAA